ncbi:putative disease resistance protein [Acorus gramineus]|uniref:Disease resistance protein n=1 Tax=Acorus gramineus TaxID=55184 RepID=A0AAV9AV09_ACOGR|nr:putative disease resistance protein [Acorus gramineus]
MNCAFSNIVVVFHGDIYHISLKKEKNVHHPELLDPAKQIIEMCDHRPIILMAIGNILSSRMQTPTEWQKVAKLISWALPVNSNEWSNVFRLVIGPERHPWQAYYKCLLYFGIFPRDHIIDAKTLTRLWVAEDFIQPTRWKTAEEVAEEYLEELIRRNIIEIVTVNSVGGVETCRIHKLFQVFCFLKAENTRFFSTNPSTNARRLVICKTTTVEEKPVIKNQPDPQNLQTLLAFEPDEQQLDCLYHGQPRLKVLHCEGHILRSFNIGGMHLLRYLYIKHTASEDDLYNISHLHHLQMLSVDFSCGYDTLVKPVIDLSRLRKLRHLILLHTSYLGEISLNGLEAAKGLQTLVGVNAGDWIESSLHKLTNLRTLKMKGCKDSHGEALAKSLVQMKRLVTLHLVGEGGFPSLPTLSSLVHLIELEMGNPLSYCNLNEPVPQSHKELPPSLKKLTLWRCQPTHYPMEFLGKLESLQALHDEVWHMERGDFPNLQVLELVGVKRVVEWIIDEGALSRLHQLSIVGCRNLKTLPRGLKHISTLRRLELSNSFEERIKEGTGEDWDEIKHVPEINARYVDLDENRDLRLQ